MKKDPQKYREKRSNPMYNIGKTWLKSCRTFSDAFRKYVAHNYIAMRICFLFLYPFSVQLYRDQVCDKKSFKYKMIIINFKKSIINFFMPSYQNEVNSNYKGSHDFRYLDLMSPQSIITATKLLTFQILCPIYFMISIEPFLCHGEVKWLKSLRAVLIVNTLSDCQVNVSQHGVCKTVTFYTIPPSLTYFTCVLWWLLSNTI